MDRKVKAASVSVISNVSLLVMKLVVGVLTGSISIISAAADSLNDLVASLIALLSVRASGVPADDEHPYGHGKIENISAAVQALLIFGAAIYIIYEAIRKIVNPRPLESVPLGLVVMGITALVDVFVSRYLLRVSRETDSAAIRADAYHLTTDVWTCLGVFAGLILIEFSGLQIVDPIVALGVAATILWVAYSLTRESANMLLDRRLPTEEIRILEEAVMGTPKVVGYHKLRTRKSGSAREIDFHLIVPAAMPVMEAHNIAQKIENKMRARLPNTTVVTHIEPDTINEISKPDTEIRRRPAFRFRPLRARRVHRR
ncbi:MAG: cation diffusion facilitator family transporter [Armatimonadota bacterium]|nr:cation diffusion facilitator family transporter [bacterium]